jgi:hypothetical protein
MITFDFFYKIVNAPSKGIRPYCAGALVVLH